MRFPARRLLIAILIATATLTASSARAGAQTEEQLASSVVTLLSHAVSDSPVPERYADSNVVRSWLDAMAPRLGSRFRDARERSEFLATVHYEATRAGLDPQLVLSVIQHESGFKKYAVSLAGARGYLQVMPFWSKLIGTSDHNLFHLRTNLRYGCVILRHYLNIEKGDVFRALGRYNGSLGRPEYPEAVLANFNRHWQYVPSQASLPIGPLASANSAR
ncbi:MAG: lytic transglycosylase domain-containing protein [Pseudomonadota bacterium]|nr:lytic transglycosylase domain-containing protein [Pseudomonadota bacterium]